MATSLISFAVIPFTPGFVIADLNIGLLFLLAMSSLGVYSVVLAGWSSNNKYSLLGGLRAAAQMLSYEVFMGLSLMGVVVLAGSFRLTDIVEAQRRRVVRRSAISRLRAFSDRGRCGNAPVAVRSGRGGKRTDRRISLGVFGHEVRHVFRRRIYRRHPDLRHDHAAVFRRLAWTLCCRRRSGSCIKTFFFICLFILFRAALPRPRFDQLMSWGWKTMLPLALAESAGYRSRGAGLSADERRSMMFSLLRSLWEVFLHTFHRRVTVQYPEEKPYLAPRYRGRIILTRDPDGGERCVACNLCAVACPVDCIALQATEDEHGRRYPEFFRINFSRCIFCGYCEEACPTYAIQLTPDFEMGEYKRRTSSMRKKI